MDEKLTASKNWFIKFCVFWNLLEPGAPYAIMSISKVSMWFTAIATPMSMIIHPTTETLSAAIAAQVVATGNYAYRRHVQKTTKTGGYSVDTPAVDATATPDAVLPDQLPTD